MATNNSKTILFITGAFVHHSCWDEWKDFFQKLDYRTYAPPWPEKDFSAKELRQRHPDLAIASIRLSSLIAHYENIVKSMPDKPIIIGHSIGGLIAQILNNKNLASAVVAIHSVPPQGVFTFKWSFLKAGWGPLGLFTNADRTFMMNLKQWQYAFTNGMLINEQLKGYDQFVIPESKRIVRDTTTAVARIDFDKPHNPLLFIAGSTDHTIPASLNYDNYKKYRAKNSVTDFVEFESRNHFVLGQHRWEEIATYIDKWLHKNLKNESTNFFTNL